VQGEHLYKSLDKRLRGPNALAAPYTFDIRGGGGFWGIEFDFTGEAGKKVDFKGDRFAMLAQARALQNCLVVMAMTGGASLKGDVGETIILAPVSGGVFSSYELTQLEKLQAYNVTREEIDKIVDILVTSIEEILKESLVA
jgi:hypothetical protein